MALWGGRFAQDAEKCVRDFTQSISYDKRLYKHDIEGSKAHALMLGASGIIPQASAEAICARLDEICGKIEAGDFKYQVELEDIHMHIRSLQKALVAQAEANKRTILPGFTHLQHAQPVLFAHHLLAYVEMLDRDCGRLLDARKRLNVLPLGSGAIAGTTLPIDREFVRKKLNFPSMTRNSMDAVASRDFTCEVLAALAIFAMNISRLSEDIILWMSQEFSFIMLSDAFCTGSSLMPQKKNPDIAEISRGKTGRVYGALMSILTICKGLPLTYNRDLQEDKEGLFDAIDTVNAILSVYPHMIETMKVFPERMAQAASDPGLMATDLAEELVRKGVPFRHAHHKVGALVRFAAEHNKALNEVTLEEMKSVFPEADEAMLHVFSAENAVAGREVFGGTGFQQVASQIEFWKKELAGPENGK